MKKIILFISFLSGLSMLGQTITGTPVHAYNLSGTNTSANFFNQAQPYKKFQFIYTNSELGNFATPITASVPITQLWFKHSGTTTPPATSLTNFKVLIGHSNTAPNTLDTNFNLNYSTAPLTCLNEPTFVYTVSGQWVGINLTTPFPYDGISNICIQIEYTASSNIIPGNIVSTANQTLFASNVTAVKGALALNRPYIGFAAGPPCSVPSFALPNDSLVCGTNTITLNVPTNVNNTTLYTYQWIRKVLPTSPTGVNVGTGLTLTTTNTTATYVLVVSNIPFTCSKRDSITVTYSAPAPTFTLGPDKTFCAVNNTSPIQPVPLITPTAGLTFQWTGTTLPPSAPGPITGIPTPTAQTTTPPLAGQYVFTVTRGLCKTRDTIRITTPVPTFALANDTTVCNGVPLLITAPAIIPTSPVPPGFTVAWFSHPFASFLPLTPIVGTGSITAPLTNTDHFYVFVVSGPNGCIKRDSIRVRYNSSSLTFTLIKDTFFCKTPNVIQLKPTVPIPVSGLTFSWSALDLVANTPVALIPAPTNNQIYTPTTNAGRYILRVTDANGCVTRDTVKLFDRSVPIFDLMPFTLSKDTAVCTSSAAFAINVPLIVSTTPPYTYTWITHPFTSYTPNVVTTGVSFILTNPTVFQRVYTLRVFNGFCFRTDSMRVTYDSVPLFSLGQDLTYCGTALNNTNPAAPNGVQLKPIPLIAPIGTLTFQWTGTTIPPAVPAPITGIPTSNAQTTTPPNPGQYILTVTKGLCKRRDTILLRPAIPTNIKLISKDTSLCLSQNSLTIPIPTSVSASPPYSYSWYQYNVGAYAGGTTLPSGTTTVTAILPTTPQPLGQYYTLTVSNLTNTCSRKDSIKVRFGGSSALFSLIADTFYCGATNNVILKPITPVIPPLTNPTTIYTFQWTGTTIAPAVPGVNITGAALGTTPTLQTTTPPGPGQYVLTSLNVSSGCKFSDTVILRNRRIGDAQFTDRDTSICDAAITSITLTAPPVPGTNLGNPYTYNWIQHPFLSLVPSTSVSTLSTVVATNAFTNHWYVVNISNGFCIDKDSVRVRFGLPTAINLIKDTFYCSAPNNNVTLGPSVPLPTGVGTSFQWAGITIFPDPPNINIVGGALGTPTVQNTTPTGSGQYTLTYINSAGCRSRDTVVLRNRRVNKFDFNPKSVSLCNGEASYTINAPAIPPPAYGNAYTYTWSTYPFTGISPGTFVSNATTIVCPNTLLDNFYYLEVFNGFCKNVDSVRVRFGFPTPFTLGPDTFFCDNTNTTVQAYPIYPTPAPVGITYQWTSFGPLVPISGPTLIAITPNVTSNYVLTNTNAAGCIFKDTVLISRRYLAPISLGIDKLVCNNRYSNVPIPKPTNVVAPQTWNWVYVNLNNIPSPTGTPNSTSLTATLPGSYILNYTNGSCTVRDTIKLTYADSTIFSLGPNTFFCTSINQDTLSPIVPLPVAPWPNKPWTYLWSGIPVTGPGIITLNASNGFNTQNLVPTIAGNYLLTVTNDSGCPSRDRIILNNYKVTVPVLVSANPSGNPRDTILCNATSYALRGPNLPTPPVPPATTPFTWSYKWYKKPNVNSANLLNSTQNYTASAGAAGSGEYILFVNNGFCNDTDKINIIFSSNPVVSLGKDDTLCSPFIKALSGPNAPNPATTYLYTWTNQGSPIVLANTQTYNTANPGTYILQVNNQFGCKKNDTMIVNARTINPFVLGNDSGTCTPNSITIPGPISLPSPNIYSYSWNTSPPTFVNPPTTNNLIAFNTGTYVLTIKNGPCIRKDSIKMEFLNQPTVVLPADTNICGKNLYNIPIQPTSIDNSLTYTWSDGTTGPINNIKFDGTYTLTGSNKYCFASDNFKITSRLKPVLSSLGPDKDFCSIETFNLLLDPITNFFPGSPFSILWKPGSQTTKSINVNSPGTYIIKVTNGPNCEASDTIVIKSLRTPDLKIPDSLFICGTGSFSVNASCNAQNYLWNTGSKDSILVINEDGYYNVTASNGKCKATKNLFVDKLDPFTIGEDFDFCPENENPTIEISNRVDPYQWFKLGDKKFVDLEGKRKLVVKKPGIYYAAVTKGSCTLYDTVTIKAFKNYNIFIPNSFSPSDNNGINPSYSIKATDVKDFEIRVFTRFGELVFQSSDVNFKWDGKTLAGKKVMSGAYVYSINYKSFCTGDEVFSEKGILNVF